MSTSVHPAVRSPLRKVSTLRWFRVKVKYDILNYTVTVEAFSITSAIEKAKYILAKDAMCNPARVRVLRFEEVTDLVS